MGNSIVEKFIKRFHKSQIQNNNCEIETCNMSKYEWENINKEIEYLYEDAFDGIEEVYFGIEIEFQLSERTVNGDDIVNLLKKYGISVNTNVIEDRSETREYNNWQVMKESTCDWEVISPILNDTDRCWKELQEVCNVLKKQLKATVDENCAIHLHIQREPLLRTGNDYVKLMKLYRYLEPFTYAVSAGEESEISLTRTKKYAATLKFADENLWTKGVKQNEILEEIKNGNLELINYYFFTRLLGLSFSTASTEFRTVEFRTFNGTLNPIAIQSYVIYVVNMINAAVKNDFIEEYHGQIFGTRKVGKVLEKEYINKCLSLLAKNENQRDRFVRPLIRNNYTISQTLHDALNGKYTKEEENFFFI